MHWSDIAFPPRRLFPLALVLLSALLWLPRAARATFQGPFVAPEAVGYCNLLSNSGFEQGDNLPAWWGRHPGRDNDRNVHVRDTKVFHSGHASTRIEWWDPIAGKNKAPLQWSRYTVPVRAGSALIVSGFTKTQGVGCAGAGLHFYDAKGKHLGFRSIPGPATAAEWTPFHAQVPVPDRAVRAGFVLYTHKGGITWYDDVVLVGVPEYTARRATPKIDGVLDDSCWRTDTAITQFVRHDGAGRGKEATRAWVTFDDKALYVAFDCPFPAGARLKQEAKSHDGRTWLDDSIEVFLRPWRQQSGYYQFCVNSLGKIRDSFAQQVRWESGAVARVHREPDRWTVELRIPYNHLGLNLDTGRDWGLNLVRNDRVNGETVTWSLGGFHDPSRFGVARVDLDLRPWVRRSLAETVGALKQRLTTARHEVAAVGLTANSAPTVFRRIQGVIKAVIELEDSLRTPQAPNQLPLQEFKDKVEAVKADIRVVRRTAVEALFRAGPADDPNAFHLVPARSMVKVPRELPFQDAWITPEITLAAARDESESFQLVVLPGKSGLRRVSVAAGELRTKQGDSSIPLEWNRVLYIETAQPRAYHPVRVGWWPDVLAPPEKTFPVPAGQCCPVWFRVNVPPGAAPGTYRGKVVVTGDGRSVAVPVKLEVHAFRLPRPGTLPCAFGLYAGVLAQWYHGRKPYEQTMPPEIFARWCRFMGKYRLTPKNIGNEYRRKTDQGWDLSTLKKTIGANAAKYYPPYSFCVYRLPCPRDAQTGKTKVDPAVWVDAVRQIGKEYLRLGLPHQAYIYGVDEPQPEGYPFLKKVYGMLRESVPEFPIMQTVNHDAPRELAGLVGIWCPLSARLESDYDFYKKRITAGDRVWMYVCCGPRPPYANFFVDQPGIDHRVLFWQAWQKDVTGLLYWCVCWWRGIPGPPSGKPHFPDIPVHLSESGSFRDLGVNGDGILLWPGPDMTPWPSQRLEIIRDGIEDYEYFALLDRCVRRAQAAATTNRHPVPKELLRSSRTLLTIPATISRSFTNFTRDPVLLLERRRGVAAAIERFRDLLGPDFPEHP